MNELMSWQKIFSGKYVFTVVTAMVFAYAVYAKILTSEQTQAIIMMVVGAYFFKKSDETNGGSNVQDANK